MQMDKPFLFLQMKLFGKVGYHMSFLPNLDTHQMLMVDAGKNNTELIFLRSTVMFVLASNASL
ncbi:hypothetical protein RB24_08590 [Herbaspirillum rubrisubalbicans]|uniref:Uncharacterized protein n=1 Tax=Herbaspirillum rubrisubalbicans TaxID=80842 RepID=A0ABX9C4H3_9BURK|nr:hypothetical protein RB24_08590 [Herbaspirillum rubrisubalbicans]